jgi:hypothetical protein
VSLERERGKEELVVVLVVGAVEHSHHHILFLTFIFFLPSTFVFYSINGSKVFLNYEIIGMAVFDITTL